MTSNPQATGQPWYRYPIMWLVIAPPIGAVIAGIITFILILEHPDPEVARARAPVAAIRGHGVNSVVPPAD